MTSSCSSRQNSHQSDQYQAAIQPGTLVIDEASCKQCVRDLSLSLYNNSEVKNIVILTADPLGEAMFVQDSTIKVVPRREIISQFGEKAISGSFFKSTGGVKVPLNAKNYKGFIETYEISEDELLNTASIR